MALKFKTRLNVLPTGRSRIMIYFHESQLKSVEDSFIEELLKLKDCAIYYESSVAELCNETPDSIQLIVVLVIASLLKEDAGRISEVINKARQKNTPVIPVLNDDTSSDELKKLFGPVQYIRRIHMGRVSETYIDKMTSMLDTYLVSDEMREKIVSCFRKKIFLSYRKIDRQLARKLISEIHRKEENFDIAIWYDEMLRAGREYNEEILEELKSSDLFLLTVSPSVFLVADDGRENYVVRIEIPRAKDFKKKILAVEMDPTESGWGDKLQLTESQCVPFRAIADQCTQMMGGRKIGDMNPDEQFLIGLAYMQGILTEENRERGLKLIEESANRSNEQAIRDLMDRYFYGNGVSRDYSQSFEWLTKLLGLIDDPYDKYYELDTSVNKYLEIGKTDYIDKLTDLMLAIVSRIEQNNNFMEKASNDIKRAKIYSYLGDARKYEGMLDEAVEFARKSCDILEETREYIRSVHPVIRIVYLVHEPLVEKTLSINYDHLADYLIQLGRTEEAEVILLKQRGLFQDDEALKYKTQREDPQYTLFESIRQGDKFKASGDIVAAIDYYERALRLYEEGVILLNDEDTLLSKAGLLLRLAEVYLKCSEDDYLKKSVNCIAEAEKICDEKLHYDEENVEALRDKSIAYELLGSVCYHNGNMGTMAEALLLCKDIREDLFMKYPSVFYRTDLERINTIIDDYFSSVWEKTYKTLAERKQTGQNKLSSARLPFSYSLQGDRMKVCGNANGLFLIGTFLLSDKRICDQFGNKCAILEPNEESYDLIKEFSVNMQKPYVRNQSVLRMFRTVWLPEGMSVVLKNIGAEVLIREEPDYNHMLILYQIVDSDYDTHYILFFSLAVLEMKLAEMIATGRLNQTEWLRDDGHFRIDQMRLAKLVDLLCGDYFRTDLGGRMTISGIMPAVPEDLEVFGDKQYEEIDDTLSGDYYCVFIISNTN